jgi:hypothetical protein
LPEGLAERGVATFVEAAREDVAVCIVERCPVAFSSPKKHADLLLASKLRSTQKSLVAEILDECPGRKVSVGVDVGRCG